MTKEQRFRGGRGSYLKGMCARAMRVLPLAAAVLGIALGAAFGGDPVVVAQSADSGAEWKPSVTWEGRVSTPDVDCEENGLLLAPWGVYPHSNSVIVWCVAPEIFDALGVTRWDLWSPMKDRGAVTYCKNWHEAALLHQEPDGRFWCEETEEDQKRKEQRRRGREA